jgi:hypothetical protein
MKLWGRVLAAFVAAVAAAFLLKAVHPVLVLAIFLVGVAFAFSRVRRTKQAPERRTGAELLGLKREGQDPFGIVGYPLALFSRTDEPAVGELVWGRWRSLEVRVFELSFAGPSLVGSTGTPTVLACAMAQLESKAPALVAEPMAFVTLLDRPPAMPRLEAGDGSPLGRSMGVWCGDADAARRLLDDAGEWLETLAPRWGVEVRGQIAIVYGPRPEHPDIVGSLETLRELVGHVSASGALRSTDPATPAPD